MICDSLRCTLNWHFRDAQICAQSGGHNLLQLQNFLPQRIAVLQKFRVEEAVSSGILWIRPADHVSGECGRSISH
jgi:hypothetical protein